MMCHVHHFQGQLGGRYLGTVLNQFYGILLHIVSSPTQRILVRSQSRLGDTIAAKDDPVLFPGFKLAGKDLLASIFFTLQCQDFPTRIKGFIISQNNGLGIIKLQDIDESIVFYIYDCKSGIAHLAFAAYGQSVHDDLSNFLYCLMLYSEVYSHGGR